MQNVTAIIGDVVDSRKYEDRAKVQKRLIYSINYLNESFVDYIVKNVEVSSGDSVQGLFNDASMSFLYVRMLQMMMTPIKLRVGIGFGDIDYLDDSYTSNMLDGSAYHNARLALEVIEDVKENSVYLSADIHSKVLLNSANGMLKMYYQIKSKQSLKSSLMQLLYEIINPLSLDGSVRYLINEEFLDNIRSADLQIIDSSFKSNVLSDMNNMTHMLGTKDLVESESMLSTLQYKTRGTADKLAMITGTTRQNVQKFIAKDIQDDVLNTITIVNYLREIFLKDFDN